MVQTVIFFLSLTASVSWSLPPEGFDVFAMNNRGEVTSFLATDFFYQAPAWRDDFGSLQAITGLPIGPNLLSFGARSMVSPKSGERYATLLRFDAVIAENQSFSFRNNHEEWSYISTAKETWAVDYNLFWRLGGDDTGIYMSLGYYWRWLKQRWNPNWGSPLNYDTEDRESFLQSILGFRTSLFSEQNYLTFDINWKDEFSSYNFDNNSFDLALYFVDKDITLRLFAGMRVSALTMGAAYPAEYKTGMGLIFH